MAHTNNNNNNNNGSSKTPDSVVEPLANGLLTLNLNKYSAQNETNSTILVVKFEYKAKEAHELDIRKNERLILLDNSKNWWLVRKIDPSTDTSVANTGYVPSNYVKKEKKSLLQKIIPKKLQSSALSSSSKPVPPNNSSLNYDEKLAAKLKSNSFTKAIVKHKYSAQKLDELTLNQGVHVFVLEKFVDGWWQCAVQDDTDPQKQIVGLFPSNFLQEETATLNNETNLSSFTSVNQNPSLPQSPPYKQTQNGLYYTENMNSSNPKCESISSNEKDIEYYRVIYPHKPSSQSNTSINANNSELSVERNEIVKLIEEIEHDEESEGNFENLWIRVFNSEGMTGLIPANCVQPIIQDQQDGDFVFIRRPTTIGMFPNNPWYYGNISRFDTILLLNKYAQNGDYLVRDSDVKILYFIS
jgi:hypothetical protein